MSKKSNKKSVSSRYDSPMTGGMKFFLAGCVGELYLLIIRRFYINGTMDQFLMWYDLLKIFAIAGAVIAAVGAVLSFLWKADKKRRELAWYVLGGGAFLAGASGLVAWNLNTLSMLVVLVPAVLVTVILWSLFDRDSALVLSVLSCGIVCVWLCRRGTGHLSGLVAKAAVILFAVALVALVVALKQGKLKKYFSADAHKMIFFSCGIAAAGTAAGLVSLTVAYYALLALAAIIFCAAVYFTVRQL